MTLCHRKRILIFFFLALAVIPCVVALPKVIKIGGLFGSEIQDRVIEKAFRFAVNSINRDRNLLKGTRLKYDIQRLRNTDSYQASKRACQQVNLGVAALFGPQQSHLAGHINSMCNAMDIPHLEARLETRTDSPPLFSVNLYPDVDFLTKAYIDVVKSFDWKKILVLYSDDYGLLKLQHFIRTPFNQEIEIIVRQVNRKNMRNVLREAEKHRMHSILADLPVDDTHLLLKTALQEGMIDSSHSYILTNLDIENLDMEDFRHNFVNLTGFRIIPRDRDVDDVLREMFQYDEKSNGELQNASSAMATEAALMYDAVYMLAKGLEEVDHSQDIRLFNLSCYEDKQWPFGSSFFNAMNSVSFNGLSGRVMGLKEGRRIDFNLEILFMTTKGLQKVGYWNPIGGLNYTGPFETMTRGGKMGINRTLEVTSILETPFVMEKENLHDLEGNDRYEGFCVDLLKEIAEICRFKYRIEIVKDRKYGIQNDRGDWNGMVGELVDNRADLAVASLTINYLREQAIDFTKPFMNLGISILFKTPKGQTPGLFSFLNPLALEIWLYVIVAYVTVSFVMFILARFSPFEWYNPHPCNPETDIVHNVFTLSNSFWFTVGTLMQQGSDINPRALSTRIVGGIWWFFTLIIISSYTANLAAFLTVERMESPIESADDLFKQTDISYGTIAGGSTMTFFKTSDIPVYKRMWEYMSKKEPSVFVKESKEGIEKVENENYAFLMESVMIDYAVQRKCSLMQVGGLLDSKGYGIGTPIGSPYRDTITLAILELQENGKIQMLYNKWWKNTGTCNRKDKKDSKAHELGVQNVGGIFVVLLAGLALAVIVAVMEFIVNSRKNAKSDRVSGHAGHKKTQSLCSEMLEEFRFALRCRGSTKRPAFRRTCSKCSTHADVPVDSPNGVIQLRELKRSPITGCREYRSPSPLPDLYSKEFRTSSPLPQFEERQKSGYSDYTCKD
ncbi:glutamate receptor ionotropic, kainate 2-like isoform X4 [Lineus longissimus]|uniref:glutamate receptor ionotropic, kainate 2-like isoform X4 n=1 Tax=Lineus longissimus TaxID=88925 RepID=UPI00315D1C3F